MTKEAHKSFSHVTEWVFDLDNTLYPRHCDLFSQIDKQMTDYMMKLTGLEFDAARKLQKDLYRDHGTTLRGLMTTRGIDPHEFLDHAHDIDYTQLPSNPQLGDMLKKLPGRKLIYTNGSVSHAENTLNALGIEGVFDEIFDIVASEFIPKPLNDPFNKFLADHGVDGSRAAMFEDLPRNLKPAKDAGMVTVLVSPQPGTNFRGEAWELLDQDHEHIDHHTDDLDTLIGAIVEHVVVA